VGLGVGAEHLGGFFASSVAENANQQHFRFGAGRTIQLQSKQKPQ